MKEKASLQRSHSVLSNGKLTFVCLFASLSFASTFACLGLWAAKALSYFLWAAIGAGALSLVFLAALLRFRR